MSVITKGSISGLVGLGVVTALLAATMPAANAAGTDTVLRASDIDFSQTRTEGHNEFLREGLHVWTDTNSSQAKAAGYWAPDAGATALSAYTAGVSLDWIGTDPEPGLQIVLDVDGVTGNGNDYNLLVGESVYGDDWWLTGTSSDAAKAVAPSTTGGSGSGWHGTLGQWSAALPGATVGALGYSLGSGIKGEGLIHSITTPGTRYVFTSDNATEVVDLDGTVTASTPRPRALKLVLRADTLTADRVASHKLVWRVQVDGKKAYWTRQGSGDVDRFKVRFAKRTGSHKVEVRKNGVVVATYKVKTGRPA